MREIFFDSEIILYAPNYLFIEIFRLKERIIKFSKLSNEEFSNVLGIVFEKIVFIGREYITDSNKILAHNLCEDIDPADTPFVALSLQLNALIWTGDQKLKDGLRLRNFDSFFN